MCLAPEMISNGVRLVLCVCAGLTRLLIGFDVKGDIFIFTTIPSLHVEKTQHIEHVFNFSFLLTFLTFQNCISGEIRFEPHISESVVLLFTVKWLLSTPSNTATASRFLSSRWGHDLNIKQTLCFVFSQLFQR